MLLEIGHVVRPHGLRGEVVVQLSTTLEGRLAPGSTVQCRLRGRAGGGPGRAGGAAGLSGPDQPPRQLVIESARPIPGKAGPHGELWLVSLAGVSDRHGSEELGGATLLAEGVEGADGLWVHELIGAAVVEVSGVDRGEVVSVEANPASDLLVLSSGALVPLRFVVSSEPGRLTVDVPEGLFEL